jgi:hypothetical protein
MKKRLFAFVLAAMLCAPALAQQVWKIANPAGSFGTNRSGDLLWYYGPDVVIPSPGCPSSGLIIVPAAANAKMMLSVLELAKANAVSRGTTNLVMSTIGYPIGNAGQQLLLLFDATSQATLCDASGVPTLVNILIYN